MFQPAVKIMGKGVLVMLMGTTGVVVGAVVSYVIVHRWLAPDAWTGFGALAGSWIGGTGNMAATSEMLSTPPEQFGLAVLADNVIYIVWLPILLASKNFADKFNRWAKVDPRRIEMMESAAAQIAEEDRTPAMRDYLYLAAIAIGVTWLAASLATDPVQCHAGRCSGAGSGPVGIHLADITDHHHCLAALGNSGFQPAECNSHWHGDDLCICCRYGSPRNRSWIWPGTGVSAGRVYLDFHSRRILPARRETISG